MTIKAVAVIGAGQMGRGIAQVTAVAGIPVQICDISTDALDAARKAITGSLSRLVEKERLTQEQMDAALALISTTTEMAALADSDLIVEAVSESETLKTQLLQTLDKLCKPSTIFATNTSSISITRLAAQTQRPEQVIGMHFMNPVPVMQLVEVIRGLQTSDAVYRAVCELSEAIGKTQVSVKDAPGFVVNRILLPMINEAIFVYAEGLATAEAIDQAMLLGTNQPIGPLALADLIGLDTCLSIMEVLAEGFGDQKYRPCPLLRQMVDAGYLGRKSGRGFYQY